MEAWVENKVAKAPPFIYTIFMKIAEPRVKRLLYFGIYICMSVVGFWITTHPPATFQSVIGLTLVYVFGAFVLGGGVLGLVSVLPGIWWLERVAVISLGTGMLMYSVIVIALNSSVVGVGVSIAFALTFMLRWMDIREYQLAPREG